MNDFNAVAGDYLRISAGPMGAITAPAFSPQQVEHQHAAMSVEWHYLKGHHRNKYAYVSVEELNGVHVAHIGCSRDSRTLLKRLTDKSCGYPLAVFTGRHVGAGYFAEQLLMAEAARLNLWMAASFYQRQSSVSHPDVFYCNDAFHKMLSLFTRERGEFRSIDPNSLLSRN